MAQAEALVPDLANFPEYPGPGLPTQARNIVAALTFLPPEKFIQNVDDNVAARESAIRSLPWLLRV